MKQSVGYPRHVIDEAVQLNQSPKQLFEMPVCVSPAVQDKAAPSLPKMLLFPCHTQEVDGALMRRSLFWVQADMLEFSKVLPDSSFYSILSHTISHPCSWLHISQTLPGLLGFHPQPIATLSNYSESRFDRKPQNHLKPVSIKPDPWHLLCKISSVNDILCSPAQDKACLLSHRWCATVNLEYSQVFLCLLAIFMSLAAFSILWISYQVLPPHTCFLHHEQNGPLNMHIRQCLMCPLE